LPVTIRLLDPPLHEFLPKREQLMVDIAVCPVRDAKRKKPWWRNTANTARRASAI
jgi:phosphoenolpyruvate synthase/pyruvate phosphate dikinase